MNKTETKSTVLVKHHLKQLKLPTMLAECEKIADRAAADKRLTSGYHTSPQDNTGGPTWYFPASPS